MWLNISKSQSLVIIYRASGRWRVKWKLERCTNQRWGAQVQTNRNYVLPRWFVVVVFGATDRHSTCAYQKLMESSKQPNSVLGGCHHASLMQILVSISRISIPLSQHLTNGRAFPQREACVCTLIFEPCKVYGTTKKPAYISYLCRSQPCLNSSLEEPRSSQRLDRRKIEDKWVLPWHYWFILFKTSRCKQMR